MSHVIVAHNPDIADSSRSRRRRDPAAVPSFATFGQQTSVQQRSTYDFGQSSLTETTLRAANVASSSFFESVYKGFVHGNFSSRLSPAIAQVSKAVEQILTGAQTKEAARQPPPPLSTQLTSAVYDFLASRTTLETTSILLAISTFFVLAMSWTSRLGNLGRFSPFGRSPPHGSTKVSDADYSYITAEDLRKHQAESFEEDDGVDLGPPRDTDMLVLRNKKQEYHVHFPAYSIAKGELTIGQVRDHAARKFNMNDARRVKLLYRGKNLKDDSRTCKQEGLRDRAELLITVAENIGLGSPSDSEDDTGSVDGLDDQNEGGGESKRRRNRGKKTKRRNKREERQGTSDASPSRQDGRGLGLDVPPSLHASRSHSPRPAASPATPLDKLNALHQKLLEYVPDCRKFIASPPSDLAKKEFEHKRLSETIMTQVLLKLDAIETEGDADARSRRKELVRETQQQLTELDAVMKS